MKAGSLLTIALVVLCLGGSALADNFTPYGDPVITGSWVQGFNDQNATAFNNIEIVMTAGGPLESPGITNFSNPGWSVLFGATDTTASGPLTNNLTFYVHFLSGIASPLTFNFFAYQDTTLLEYATADWTGHAWVITEHAPASLPEPTSLMLFGSGLIGVAGVIRRKLVS